VFADVFSSGATSLACLNSMLHSNCRGLDSVFYKVAGRTAVYGLTVSLSFYQVTSLLGCKVLFFIKTANPKIAPICQNSCKTQ